MRKEDTHMKKHGATGKLLGVYAQLTQRRLRAFRSS